MNGNGGKKQPSAEKSKDHNYLYKVAAQKGMSREDTNLIIQYKFQKDDATQLTEEEIAEMVKGIQSTSKDRLQEFLIRFKASLEEHEFVA